jgi:hypothetical protein
MEKFLLVMCHLQATFRVTGSALQVLQLACLVLTHCSNYVRVKLTSHNASSLP